MGRDKASELQKCLSHNTAMHTKIVRLEDEIERLTLERDQLRQELDGVLKMIGEQ